MQVTPRQGLSDEVDTYQIVEGLADFGYFLGRQGDTHEDLDGDGHVDPLE
ncbi:Uncharacterised protein [Mycobacteroides abscessus subsp. abscessus]|nr:Uncharacterised protein [Mycobacteroides abscessus subsp. abscessus]